MSVTTAGQQRAAGLPAARWRLEHYGLWEISAVVLVTTFAAPLARVLCMLAVLLGLRLPRPPAELRAIFAWVEHLRPWSMVEIYLLGLFVAYVRLSGMATVDLGPAIFALGALMVIMVLADYTLDEQAVWEAMEPRNRRPRRGMDAISAHRRRRAAPAPLAHRLRHLRAGQPGRARACAARAAAFACTTASPPRSQRTWAFALAALVLYIPANIYPVLTVIRLGAGQPSTILGGVRELMEIGMWPLAALVFFASVAVPVLKLIGLGILLISTHIGTDWACTTAPSCTGSSMRSAAGR